MFILTQLIADDCIYAANTFVDLTYIDKCFRSIKFSAETADSTLTSLLGLSDVFAFRNSGNQSNEFNLTPVDTLNRLKQLKGKQFLNDFDFHDALSAIYQDLFDAHTLYVKPTGYGNFKLALPYKVEYVGNKYFLRRIYTDNQTKQYHDLTQTKEIADNTPLLFINSQAPGVFLSQLADSVTEGVFVSKEHNARFNDLLKGTFSSRSIRKYALPKTLSYDFVITENNSLVTVTLPFALLSGVAVASVDDIIKSNTRQTGKQIKTVSEVLGNTYTKQTQAAEQTYDGYKLIELIDGKVIKFHKLTNVKDELVAFQLTVVSFSPSLKINKETKETVDVDNFVDDFQKAMEIFDNESTADTKLLIDLQGNGGGYITLGFRMLHVLRPHLAPKWGNYSIRSSDANKKIASFKDENNPFASQERFTQYKMELYKDSEYIDNYISWVQGDPFSGVYSFDLAYDEVVHQKYFERLSNIKTPKFLQTTDNDKIVFITDGLCGSTCACFALRANAERAGVFVGVGGDPASNGNLQVASFVGGSVMDTTQTDLIDLNQFGIKPFPTTALHRWAHEQIYDWRVKGNVVLEYRHVPVDFPLDVWFELGNENKGAEIAVKAFQKASEGCFGFQHSQADCGAKNHVVYGRMCSEHEFKGECVFVGCELGYVERFGACVEAPAKHFRVEEKGISSTLEIVICVIVGIATAAIAAFVLFVVLKDKFAKH